MGGLRRHGERDDRERAEEGSTRRHFLRRAGITGEVAAALVGVTDVLYSDR